MMMSDAANPAAQAGRLVALTTERHGELRLDLVRRFGSARSVIAVPLLLPELGEASVHYPLGFLREPTLQIVAVLGIRTGENLFVDETGAWADGAYIPAILRRQPLTLGRTDTPDSFAVVIDEAHEALSTTRGQPLFDDAAPTPLTRELMELCREVSSNTERTERFVAAVDAEGLLDDAPVAFNLPGEGQSIVQGLLAVQPQRLAQLGDETVVNWHRQGFLPGIHYHLASSSRWPALLRRAQANKAR